MRREGRRRPLGAFADSTNTETRERLEKRNSGRFWGAVRVDRFFQRLERAVVLVSPIFD